MIETYRARRRNTENGRILALELEDVSSRTSALERMARKPRWFARDEVMRLILVEKAIVLIDDTDTEIELRFGTTPDGDGENDIMSLPEGKMPKVSIDKYLANDD